MAIDAYNHIHKFRKGEFRHNPWKFFTAELYQEIYPNPLFYLNIYMLFILITYFFKGLFLLAVWGYFWYYGGLHTEIIEKCSRESEAIRNMPIN